MDWQSIETAPMDGTEILAFTHEGPRIVWRVDGDDGYWEDMQRMLAGATPFRPTHWMPLPEPPQ